MGREHSPLCPAHPGGREKSIPETWQLKYLSNRFSNPSVDRRSCFQQVLAAKDKAAQLKICHLAFGNVSVQAC